MPLKSEPMIPLTNDGDVLQFFVPAGTPRTITLGRFKELIKQRHKSIKIPDIPSVPEVGITLPYNSATWEYDSKYSPNGQGKVCKVLQENKELPWRTGYIKVIAKYAPIQCDENQQPSDDYLDVEVEFYPETCSD
ncbi:MAG: hypothetical protein SWJ54_12820 [Cyanobacteriota bacterium]|nr:hypothetical protein [Cyanobacteriota bacterium]